MPRRLAIRSGLADMEVELLVQSTWSLDLFSLLRTAQSKLSRLSCGAIAIISSIASAVDTVGSNRSIARRNIEPLIRRQGALHWGDVTTDSSPGFGQAERCQGRET